MAAPAATEKPAEAAKPAEAPAASPGGGMKSMLPLILNIVLMPAIAFAMTQFVILPKLNSKPVAEAAHGDGEEGHGDEAAAADAHGGDAKGEKADKGHGAEKKADKGHGEEKKADKAHGGDTKRPKGAKNLVPLSAKTLVNVAGTMGTRYLLANITLVGVRSDLKDFVEKHDAQLRDVSSSVLSAKSIADLEKPGARNLIRSELIAAFNTVLGEGVVQEIYFTEFAVQ
jgi:flagellar FliL protein